MSAYLRKKDFLKYHGPRQRLHLVTLNYIQIQKHKKVKHMTFQRSIEL